MKEVKKEERKEGKTKKEEKKTETKTREAELVTCKWVWIHDIASPLGAGTFFWADEGEDRHGNSDPPGDMGCVKPSELK